MAASMRDIAALAMSPNAGSDMQVGRSLFDHEQDVSGCITTVALRRFLRLSVITPACKTGRIVGRKQQ
jgi:hypothetical protein